MFSRHRTLLLVIVAVGAVMATPGLAWGHGLHYDGTMNATGDQGGTVTAIGDNCGPWTPPNYHVPTDPNKRGCVDIHKITGFTAASNVTGWVTVSGSDLWPNTTFRINWLNTFNDSGDLTDNLSDPSDEGIDNGYPTDLNSPYCHFLAPLVGTATTDPSGNLPSTTVSLGAANFPDAVYGQSELCITSTTTKPDGTGGQTSQGNSTPIMVVPGVAGYVGPPPTATVVV